MSERVRRPIERWVIDASVALKWYLSDERYVQQAKRLEERWRAGQAYLTAPSFIVHEVSAGLVVAAQKHRLRWEQIVRASQHFAESGISLMSGAVIAPKAVELLKAQPDLKYFDALYAALGEFTGYPVITADQPLTDCMNKLGLPVVHIRDYK